MQEIVPEVSTPFDTAASQQHEPQQDNGLKIPVPSDTSPQQAEAIDSGFRPIVFADYAGSSWTTGALSSFLYIDGEQKAFLAMGMEELFPVENDGTFLLEKRMFSQPYGEKVAYTLTVGEVTLVTDGNTVKLSVIDDPLGILAYAKADGLQFRRDDDSGYPFVQSSWEALKQPNTTWSLCYYAADTYVNSTTFRMSGDMEIYGSVDLKGENVWEDCSLFYCNETYMLVGKEGPLFYGYRYYLGDAFSYARNEFVEIMLRPIYDPYDMAEGGYIYLRREADGIQEDMGYLPGANLEVMKPVLLAAGWTDETDALKEVHPGLIGRIARFMKDGSTLVIFYSSPDTRFGKEVYMEAFVIYEKDGSVLCWCGAKPADHILAEKGLTQGWIGDREFNDCRLNAEAPYIYTFLDNGYLAIEGVWDDSEDFVSGFDTYRMIP